MVRARAFSGGENAWVRYSLCSSEIIAHMGIPFSGSGGWLWRFRNKVVHGEAASGDSGVVEPFHLKFQKLIMEEDLSLSQIYNANETCYFLFKINFNLFPAYFIKHLAFTHRMN